MGETNARDIILQRKNQRNVREYTLSVENHRRISKKREKEKVRYGFKTRINHCKIGSYVIGCKTFQGSESSSQNHDSEFLIQKGGEQGRSLIVNTNRHNLSVRFYYLELVRSQREAFIESYEKGDKLDNTGCAY